MKNLLIIIAIAMLPVNGLSASMITESTVPDFECEAVTSSFFEVAQDSFTAVAQNAYAQWLALNLATGSVYALGTYVAFRKLVPAQAGQAASLATMMLFLKQAFDGLVNFHAENLVPNKIHDDLDELTKGFHRRQLFSEEERAMREEKIFAARKLGQRSRAIQGATAIHGRDVLAEVRNAAMDAAKSSYEAYKAQELKSSARIVAHFAWSLVEHYYEVEAGDTAIESEFRYWWRSDENVSVFAPESFIKQVLEEIKWLERDRVSANEAAYYETALNHWLTVSKAPKVTVLQQSCY